MNIIKKFVAQHFLKQAHNQARRRVWHLGQCIQEKEGLDWEVSRNQEVAYALGTDALGRVWGFRADLAVDIALGRELASEYPSTVAAIVSFPRRSDQ